MGAPSWSLFSKVASWSSLAKTVSPYGVAVLSGVVSYLVGRANAKQQIVDEIKKIREEGLQTRETAQREYELRAMQSFREATGAPKGQIIESVHDLSDRLGKFLFRKDDWTWTHVGGKGYYRRSFTWLIVRPFAWGEILRRRLVYLDQTLGDLIKDEHRFLWHLHLLDRSLTDVSVFSNTKYDPSEATAHVFGGMLRIAAESLIDTRDSTAVCCTYIEFESRVRRSSLRPRLNRTASPTDCIELLVRDIGKNPDIDGFRLARLVALYCACLRFLENFSLPYRAHEKAEQGLNLADSLLPAELRQPVKSNIRTLVTPIPDSR